MSPLCSSEKDIARTEHEIVNIPIVTALYII